MRRPRPVPLLSSALVAQLAVAAVAVSTLPAPAGPVAAPLTAEAAALLAQADTPRDEAAEITAPDDAGTAARGGAVSAQQYADAVAETLALRDASAGDPLAAGAWTAMGPTNIGGRVTDLAVDPTATDTVYAATASGGVVRSTDAGLTWRSTWPTDVPSQIGALAIGKDGVLWAGTGESNPGGGSTTFPGTGVYRSTDKGATWQRVGLPQSARFGRIVVDPTDPRRVYAAATGDLFRPAGQRGVYRTTDGGATWERVLGGDNPTTGAVDLAISPADSKVLLATLWDHQRTPLARRYAGPGSGLFRSTDGGESWTRITTVAASKPGETGRIGVAFAPSDPKRAYAVVHNKLNGTYVGLWRSEDAGATWTLLPENAELRANASSFGWWFGRVFVDPTDRERLFVAGVELQESTDGGRTFTSQTNTLAGVVTGAHQVTTHADQHAMAWDPAVADRVYLGNDGGNYVSRADGRIGSWVGAVSQGWTQHYSVGVSEQRPSRLVSGMQDNLCQRNHVEGDTGRPDTWTKYGLCGDGLQTLIDPRNDEITYGCAQNGANCSLNVAGAGPVLFGGTTGQRRGWWVPVQFDPADSAVLYYGSNVLNRSPDRGRTWAAISPDLTTQPTNTDPHGSYRNYGTITWVAVAPTDSKRIYVGTDDGLLWRSDTGGGTAAGAWTRLDDPALPEGRWVTRVAVDPADEDVVYATYSGYRNGEDAAHVVVSRDAGETWQDVTGDLPDAPTNEVVLTGDLVVVGTDTGVFAARTGAGALKWVAVGRGLPVGPVMDIAYHASTRTLTAATFGHGIQRVVLPPGTAAPAADSASLLSTGLR